MAQVFRDLQSFFSATLASSISASATSIVVSTAPAVNTGFFVLEPKTANQEIVYMSGRTGTTLTVVRGLATSGSSEADAGNGKTHAAGTAIEMVDVHYYIKQLQVSDTFTYRGSYADTTAIEALTNPETGDVALSIADAGFYWYNGAAWVALAAPVSAGDASASNKGVTKLSTAPVSATDPIAVGDNDTRIPTADEKAAMAGNSGSPSNTNRFVTEEGIPSTIFFGDGSDGDVTISSPTTLTRDMFYNNLTVNNTLTTAGFLIFVKGTLSGSGTITGGTANSGGNGGAGAATSGTATGGTAGTAGAASTTGRLRNTAGVAGNAGVDSGSKNASNGGAGTNQTSSTKTTNGVAGGGGGGGYSGSSAGTSSSGGAGGVSTQGISPIYFVALSMLGFDLPLNSGLTPYKGNASGGGGGGGGGGDSAGGTNSGGGGGGGSGASGIPVFITANIWAGTFTILSVGGNGGNGGAGGSATGFGGGGGGGGAGGNGGDAVIFYLTKTWTGAATLTGGTKGTAGTATQNGVAGSDGNNGTAGTKIEIDLTNFALSL